LAEYRRLTEELVGPKELKRAKDLLQGKLLLQMEATDNLATWYARQAVSRRKIITPGEFLKIINKITPAELQKTAKKIFVNCHLNLALIGRGQVDRLQRILRF
jgi:predicted Zn-dependent peptidase